jgi:acetyltransferase-like isoleucine patch superfamily enzyme
MICGMNPFGSLNYFEIIACFFVYSIICIMFLKYMFLFVVISAGESIRKRRIKSKQSSSNNPVHLQTSGKNNRSSSILRNAYEGMYRYLQYKVSLFPNNAIRKTIYHFVFKMKIGKKVSIHFRTEIRGGYRISIGDGTIIGDNCLLDGREGLTIGCNVNFSSNVSIYSREHDKNNLNFGPKGGPVFIGNRAWISSNSMILPNVAIGDGALVCGGAIVTHNVNSFEIVAGIPAKQIGIRNKKVDYEFDGSSPWFL